MTKSTVAIFVVLAAGLLLSCGGDGGDQRVTAQSAQLNAYSVTGTSSPILPGDPIPISPSENGGRFTLEWSISADGVVDLEAGACAPNSGKCGESLEFIDHGCGDGFPCDLQGTITCTFNNSNQISCPGAKGANLSSYLDQIPKEADMILCARDLEGTHCDAVRVEFR